MKPLDKNQRPALGRPSSNLRKSNYFLGAIASFAAFATRNFTTVFALIWMGSPVCGLRPMRALRCAFTRRPSPGTTNTPFFFVSLMAVSARCSRNAAACLLLSSFFSARRRTSCVLVKPDAMYFLLGKNNVIPLAAILLPQPCGKTPDFTRVWQMWYVGEALFTRPSMDSGSKTASRSVFVGENQARIHHRDTETQETNSNHRADAPTP